MDFRLNGTDYYTLLSGYKVEYKKVLGPNSYVSLDGTIYEDVIARKMVLDVEFRPMTSTELKSLVTVCQNDTLTVIFTDPKTDTQNILTMIPTLSHQSVLFTNADTWWDKVTLNLEQK